MNDFSPFFKGRLIKDKDGSTIEHHVWFKTLLNPILRALGYVIVSVFDVNENLSGYDLSYYPLIKLPRLSREDKRRLYYQNYYRELESYKLDKRLGIKSKKPKKPKSTKDFDSATTSRGWDSPPMFAFSNTPLPSDGDGTPSDIKFDTPTLYL